MDNVVCLNVVRLAEKFRRAIYPVRAAGSCAPCARCWCQCRGKDLAHCAKRREEPERLRSKAEAMSRAGARLVLQAISLENPEAFAAASVAARANPWGLLEDPEGTILYYSR